MATFARGGHFFRSLLFSVIGCAAAYGAPIIVTPAVTTVGSLFHYNYTITNPTGLELAVLDITVARGAGTIQNLVVPVGFSKQFDSVLGLVSFLEDTSTFGATPISGFMFDSPFAPRATSFNGTLLDANFNLSNMGGTTQGPAVPEPGYFPVLSAIFCIGIFTCYRRRIPQVNGSASRSIWRI